MNTAAEENGDGDAGQQGWIQWQRRCVTATEETWDGGDGEMGWKDGDGLGKYQQVTTISLRAYCRYDNSGVGATMNLHGDLRCIWRLCVLYFNLNKITC